ncbi:MAG: IS3 family transposase, partial [Candidatus Eisenbacteria bacterium]|nr:IS3 family transposase [Candidatus Eisenbacteria bacterium]
MIEQHANEYPLGLMCRTLEVSRAGYYSYRTRPASDRELKNRLLLEQIRAVQKTTRQAYGSPRMTRELRTRGKICGRHRVARLMRKNGLGARRKKRFRKTTDSNHSLPCAENLVAREFTVSEPNRVWVADVTFIPTRERWLYLATTLDLYSRKIVGWGMGTENDTELVLRSLDMAVK